jgi:hypothetical protein
MITKLTVVNQNKKPYTWDRKDKDTPAYDFNDFMEVTSRPLVKTVSVEVTVNDIAEYNQICELCDEKNQDIVAVIYDPT